MKNNPWVWISAVALLVATALIVSSANRTAPPTGRTLGAGSADSGAFLRSVAETLNNLGGNVDLELQPAQPILTASSSKDGKEILATVSENPANPDGQYNYLLANSGNANFYSAGVEPGDIVRYYVNVDEESAERGIDQKAAALELRVRRLDSRDPENALIIETPLNGPSPVPARVEIWRFSDKRMDAIRSTLNRYRDRRLPAVGWEPAPDLGALQQIVERANQWFRSRPPAGKDWKREPLLVPVMDGIPKAPSSLQGDALENYQRSVANLEKLISSEQLRDGVFADWEGRLLAESVWARDVSQWAHGTADTDDKIAAALFDWTVRNVQLDPTPSPFVSRNQDPKTPAEPADSIHRPWQALIYGHGSAAHRAWVFVELLRQQNIAAALIRPLEADPATAPLLVGVFIGDDLQLYDPQLGLPLRSKDGGVATLAEVAADDSLLRQFDLDGEYAYGATAEQMAGVDALIVASPLQLSRRAAELEGSLEGENFVRLSADVQALADRLAKLPQVKQTNLWMQPFQAYVDEQTIGPESRVLAVDEFAPLAERPLLWQGRVLHLQGNKGVRADERNDPLAEPRDGHQQALVLYQDKNVRLSNRDLNKLEPAKRPIYSASKAAAAYWLGLLSYDRGNYDTALGWLDDRTLDQNRSSRWADGARYNLARTQEALGDNEAAIKTLESDPKDAPQRHGNLLRANQLAASAAPPADKEPPADTQPAADSTSATEEQE
jgi:hypothetical protein